MNRSTSALAIAAALCCSTLAHAQVAFDANLELDTTYVNKIDAPATNARESDLTLGGRIEINASTPTSNRGSFVKARASLLTKKDGDAAVDDLWVQFGNTGADLKLGRFEAMDLFPLGKDVLVETNVGGYEAYRAQFLRGRFGSDVFHGAVGINAGESLRIELGLVQTKEDGLAKGFRPAVAYTAGPLTLRAGVEAVKIVGQDEHENGAGVSASYQGGFNWSSQHPQPGGVYGATRRMDEAIDREGRDALSGGSFASARGRAPVLGTDCNRDHQ